MNKNLKIILFFLFLAPVAIAQDGELLFKQCNICHLIGKNSTGPNLKGVKQKWDDAGESKYLYDWVRNSNQVITMGKSTMATKIKDFSPTMMPNHSVSDEEVDAILAYVDNYVEKAVVVDPAQTEGGVAAPVEIVPNYKDNLDLFYWLLIAMVALLLAIAMISASISNLIKSDFFKKKLAEKNNSTGKLLSVGAVLFFLSMFVSNSANAFTFNKAGMAQENEPWLLIENQDIYILVLINVLLLFLLIYLRRMFSRFLEMIQTPKEVVVEEVALSTKINQILSGAVPIEEESSILMHHEYDGIQELDNNLPTWWIWGFYATIVFSVIYLFSYHVFKTSDLQLVAYEKDMKQSQIEVNAYLKKMAMNVDETNATLMTDASDISSGKGIFEANCVACHMPDGSGQIGPNLTDKNWIYGFDVKDLFKTIKLGTSNGMPEHNSKLNPIQIQQVASFVLSLPEKPGKAAEGTIIEK